MGIERVGKDKTIPKLGFFLFGDKVTNSEKKTMEVRAAKPVISSM